MIKFRLIIDFTMPKSVVTGSVVVAVVQFMRSLGAKQVSAAIGEQK